MSKTLKEQLTAIVPDVKVTVTTTPGPITNSDDSIMDKVKAYIPEVHAEAGFIKEDMKLPADTVEPEPVASAEPASTDSDSTTKAAEQEPSESIDDVMKRLGTCHSQDGKKYGGIMKRISLSLAA